MTIWSIVAISGVTIPLFLMGLLLFIHRNRQSGENTLGTKPNQDEPLKNSFENVPAQKTVCMYCGTTENTHLAICPRNEPHLLGQYWTAYSKGMRGEKLADSEKDEPISIHGWNQGNMRVK